MRAVAQVVLLKFTSFFISFARARPHVLRGRVCNTSRANRADALWMSNHQFVLILMHYSCTQVLLTELGRSSDE